MRIEAGLPNIACYINEAGGVLRMERPSRTLLTLVLVSAQPIPPWTVRCHGQAGLRTRYGQAALAAGRNAPPPPRAPAVRMPAADIAADGWSEMVAEAAAMLSDSEAEDEPMLAATGGENPWRDHALVAAQGLSDESGEEGGGDTSAAQQLPSPPLRTKAAVMAEASVVAQHLQSASGLKSVGAALFLVQSLMMRIPSPALTSTISDDSPQLASLMQHYLDARSSMLLTDVASAAAFQMSRKNVRLHRHRLAAGLVAGVHAWCDEMIAQACRRVQESGGRCVVMYEIHRGDETPFAKVRLATTLDGPAPGSLVVGGSALANGGAADDGQLAQVSAAEERITASPALKVYQAELKIGCLFELGGKFGLLTLDIPQPLQAYDDGTAEVSLQSAHTISLKFDSRKHFGRVQRLMTSDGASAIAKGERAFATVACRSGDSPVTTLHHWCLVHRVYKVVELPYRGFDRWVTLLIRFALSLRGPGLFLRFVGILRSCILDRLVYKQSAMGPGAAADQHRTLVYDTFLPTEAVDKKTRLVRRFVLMSLLNGDIRDQQTVQHFCHPGCCKDKADFCHKVRKYLMPALVGSMPPIFRRGRWTKNEDCLGWVGLLEGAHGLLSASYRQWFSMLSGRPLPPLHAPAQHDGGPAPVAARDGDDDASSDGSEACASPNQPQGSPREHNDIPVC